MRSTSCVQEEKLINFVCFKISPNREKCLQESSATHRDTVLIYCHLDESSTPKFRQTNSLLLEDFFIRFQLKKTKIKLQ